jgi:membrane-bound lytic murein transglycosylase A
MSRIAWAVVAAVTFVSFAGCTKPQEMRPYQEPNEDVNRKLRPGELALRKIDPSKYPDFGQGFYNREGLREAILHSLDYLSKPSSQKYFPYGDIATHDRAVASLQRFLEILDSAQSPQALNQAIRTEFDVYESKGYDYKGSVLFTGYYTPIFDGRTEPDAQYRYPLYKAPPDLAKDEEGQCLGRLMPDGSVQQPYPTRRQIEEGHLLDSLELAWVKNAFEAYVITVQGSAKLRLADGSLYEIGYAGNNGYDYTPIAEAMIRDRVIRAEDLSLQTLLKYFQQHPNMVYHYAWRNNRYVFFKEAPGGPFGSLGVPVTPFRSLATDKTIFPRACLAFVKTNMPRYNGAAIVQAPYSAFSLDQDTGGAIRAAGRCDVFMGIGQGAEALAGRTYAKGRLYYIFLK